MSNNKDKTNELRNEWLGLDGFLVVLYFVVAFILGYSIIHNIDFVVGRLAPYGVMTAVTLIFFKYLHQVMTFAKGVKKEDK